MGFTLATATSLASLALSPCCLRRGTWLALNRRAAVTMASGPTVGRYTDSVEEAAQALRAGQLVAFPTETVYGLGADAFNEAALLRIYEVKGRPRTDPLIVHVDSLSSAEALVSLQPAGLALLRRLARDFWPGPLTVIAPACEALPSVVTSGTGAVGVRCPSGPRALELLRAAGIPVCAPSANRFGHVSPTRAEHVMADLGGSELLVLRQAEGASCQVGIESTVVKLDEESGALLLLRRGGLPEATLAQWLRESDLPYELKVKPPPSDNGRAVPAAQPPSQPAAHIADINVAQQAPGMLLTHYAPDLPSYLLRPPPAAAAPAESAGGGGGGGGVLIESGGSALRLSELAVVDFGGGASHLEGKAAAYRDLAPDGDAAAAAAALFDVLRWAEGTQALGARAVLLPTVIGDCGPPAASNAECLPALADRLFRAASGRHSALGVDGTLRQVDTP